MNTTVQDIPELDLKQFNELLVSKNPEAQHGPLWYAWHYLQVYTHYGLQLPHTQATLKLQLGISDPGRYTWFDPAVEAYDTIYQASQHFIGAVFPGVVGLGNDLMSFAQEATGKDGNFSAMIDLLDDNEDQAALELVDDLRTKAIENSKKAAQVATDLGTYKGKLVTAIGQLSNVKTKINQDDQVSQKTIDGLLSQDPKSSTSIKAVEKFLADAKANYEHNVVVAATTPTYAWVLPTGLIAAIVVASIYGKRATDEKAAIDSYESQLKQMALKLRTAIETRSVLEAADYGISNALSKTELAERDATTVQNAWNQLVKGVDEIKTKISGMLREQDGQKKLATKRTIQLYAKQAADKWEPLVPVLHDLTDEPYISIRQSKPTFGEMLTEIKNEASKAT